MARFTPRSARARFQFWCEGSRLYLILDPGEFYIQNSKLNTPTPEMAPTTPLTALASFCRKSQDSPVHPALFEFSTGAIFACFFD
jgi:hypothetical protein